MWFLFMVSVIIVTWQVLQKFCIYFLLVFFNLNLYTVFYYFYFLCNKIVNAYLTLLLFTPLDLYTLFKKYFILKNVFMISFV